MEKSDNGDVWLLCMRLNWPSRRRAAEQRDDLASFPLTEMHPIPHGPERIASISDCSRSVSGYGRRAAAKPEARLTGSGAVRESCWPLWRAAMPLRRREQPRNIVV